jgi:nucleoside-diphosphate-sugar epimerase
MDALKNVRVLVAGGAGWLGRALIQALMAGLPDVPALAGRVACRGVRTLARPGEDLSELRGSFPDLEIVEGDVRSSDDCARFCRDSEGGLLISTVGVIHPRRVREFTEVNVGGTGNLLRAAAGTGLRRFVAVSSNSPCGCNPHPDHRFDEDSPYHPYLNYGRSKMLMELAVREAQGRGTLETVLVRPPWFYGPFQPARQTLFFRMIRDGKMPIVGSGNGLRSMAYIDNLCQGLLLAGITPRASGRTYWIADDRPYTMNEIVDTVERLLETEFGRPCARKRLRLPGIASGTAYVIDSALQSLGLYSQKIHVLSEMNKTIACSIARARAELGYDPKIALEEGMRRSLRWVIDRGLLP